MDKARWSSVWHQLDEVLKLNPVRVLEIGPGPGVFKIIGGLAGLHIETLDLDPDLKPDHIGSATNIPLSDSTFDVVCAFQILEHLLYEQSLVAFAEMARVSCKYIVISLPDSKIVWRYSLYIPKIGSFEWLIPRPFAKVRTHKFDGEHYWEINTHGYLLSKVVRDLTKCATLVTTYRVPEIPYHRFFIFEK